MTKGQRLWASAAIAIGAVLLTATGANAGERWLHVKIDGGPTGEQVAINLPTSTIGSMLSEDAANGIEGDFDLDGFDLGPLPEILTAVRDAPDAVFVTVRAERESLQVAKQDGLLLVHVDEHGAQGERVRVQIPIAVVEALVAGDGTTLDLGAALRALERFDGDDLVRIDSAEESVRVWIDDHPGGS
jgi:hypothetical protein